MRPVLSTGFDRAPVLSLCTGDTGRYGRVEIEPGRCDLFAAVLTIAKLTLVHAHKGGINAQAPCRAAAAGGLRHRLTLHRVHATEASDGLLIERDRSSIAGGLVIFGEKRGTLCLEDVAKAADICVTDQGFAGFCLCDW